ncbi:putative ciliary rootlet coiled-coil protein 2 isoform X1 [Passer montanus]|uniref:putative ciliary rootlet coiled-coil protein 2 isoform X1 n=1 Tax=Passer montanus TaxID=9160 RepID=UPI00196179F3|nr:putative ciliary rootlet coiled-coil protein 2 isoform X1 [Passer montanus]
MDPAVPRATLKVLALCAALLVLVAAVTVAVAVSLWRSEALGQLQGCRERAVNESRELGTHLGELERDRERLRSDGDTLRRELARAQGDSARDNASLVSCRERAARLEANVTALGNELVALRRERAELAGDKVTLQEEVARGAEQARGLRRRLQEALEQQRELWERRERCEGRQRELQDSLRDYAAELEALRRRARDRGSGRRCPPGHRAAGPVRDSLPVPPPLQEGLRSAAPPASPASATSPLSQCPQRCHLRGWPSPGESSAARELWGWEMVLIPLIPDPIDPASH